MVPIKASDMSYSDLKLQCKSFDQLDIYGLYDLLRLRQEIFIVEQDCPYLDCDGKDLESHHLLAYLNDELIAYTRLLPKGVSYPEYSSIGRVVTNAETRGTGLGKIIMKASIQQMRKLYPEDIIKISAQVYALPFYEKLGFIAKGEQYLEDDIPHQAMTLDFKTTDKKLYEF